MFRFSIRGLAILTVIVAVLAACGLYFLAVESPVERDVRLYGELPMENPDRLFDEVDRLAELGAQAQSASSIEYLSADESQLTRVELAQLASHFRKQYPLVSLRTRLRYESTATRRKPVLAKETLARMELAEDPSLGGTVKARFSPVRTRALQNLHSDWVFQFITQEGVGFSRMTFPSVRHLELADSQAVMFDAVDAPHPGREVVVPSDEPGRYTFERDWQSFDSDHYQNGVQLAFTAWAEVSNPMGIPTRPRLQWYYEQDRLEFSESGRNGYAKDIDHVAGFAPHKLTSKRQIRMDQPFGSYDSSTPAPANQNWVLKSLQLVSLLKHERPQVYDSKRLPSMEATGDEFRDLDAFEREGLEKLFSGDDICIKGRENQVRMLGSLRAIRQCLDCHTVERGDLLGAFTYEFVRSESLSL